ncbi:MAG TPA: hypothetical protein PLE74_02645 [Candidatus Cloacimonadota bacterium]|nr:hypothetical protein [Candidatus Cloacimonadota bacterium]HPT71162.1 hypothetical protein [Candidatus Cloacimonadota bacterium]
MKIRFPEYTRGIVLTFMLLLAVIGLSAAQLMVWKPLPMKGFGTKRVLKEGKSSVLYYRSVSGKTLDLGTVNQTRVRISVFTKKDSLKFKYTVIVDKEKKTFQVLYKRKAGNYFCYEDMYLNLLPGQHRIQINTANRNAYFRAFYPQYKKIYPPISLAKPTIPTDTVLLNKGATKKVYYIATADKPYQTTVTNKYTMYGYARASILSKTSSGFEIYRNGSLVRKVDISPKKTKLYTNAKYANISIGKKFDIPLVEGKNIIVIKPIGTNPIIFRIFKERKDAQ